ncbi:MAG: hypothetical protein FDZ70_00235 [Actinobacteria bacterium]|nr:MAG: hypothetical protein FDZ70_00235 [Actinomycetota bacterium]
MAERLAIDGGPKTIDEPVAPWPQHTGSDEDWVVRSVRESNACASASTAVGYTIRFEREFAEMHGRRYGVACCSCTQGLEAMVAIAGIEPGDEVIVPPYTFMATAACVIRAGGVPVFGDVDPLTMCLDIRRLDEVRTERTKAVIPVHFGGFMDDMVALRRWAEPLGITVIEDAAQAHAARRDGWYPGEHSMGAVFSFQRNKNMSAGEGGVYLTDDEDLMLAFREFIWHGTRQGGAPGHFSISSNLRITEFQSALLLAQMERLEEQTRKRMDACDALDLLIDGIPGFTRLDASAMEVHPRHLYIVRLDRAYWGGVKKATVLKALQAEGVVIGAGYDYPLYRNPVFVDGNYPSVYRAANAEAIAAGRLDFSSVVLPEVERACGDVMTMPHFVFLSDYAVAERVGSALAKVSEARDRIAEMDEEA